MPVITEAEALITLQTIARLRGGTLRELELWPQNRSDFNARWARREPWGFCVNPRYDQSGVGGGLSFVWSRKTGRIQQTSGYHYLEPEGVLLIGGRVDADTVSLIDGSLKHAP